MTNEHQHNVRVVTELWHQMHLRKTENNEGLIRQAQLELLKCAFAKYSIIDISAPGPGIRIPHLVDYRDLDGT